MTMADIVTLTLNPAVDLSTSVDRVVPTIKLRCAAPKRNAGGGGVNVARVIRRFGGEVEAIFPAGGFTGQILRQLIDDEAIPYRCIEVAAETREDFAVSELRTAKQYHFVTPGSPLHEPEWSSCLERLAATAPRPMFVIGSGSLPPGVPSTFYARAAELATALGARFAVDTSGAPLAAALEHGVYLIKPNLREFCDLAGATLASEHEWIAAARRYIDSGKVEIVALSLGHLGAFLIARDQTLRARPLAINPVSSVGAGDSFLGALMFTLANGASLADALRLGVAAGTAALMNEGTELCHPSDAYRLSAQVTIERV